MILLHSLYINTAQKTDTDSLAAHKKERKLYTDEISM